LQGGQSAVTFAAEIDAIKSMKWSWKVAQIAGIGVYVHFTFIILLGWVGVSHFLLRHSWQDAASGLVFIVTLFGIVVLHELGHALTARRFGIRTRDITLLPIGGVARLERMPDDPKQELLVALAGPAVNIVLAALLLSVLVAGAKLAALTEVRLVGGDFLSKLMWVNVGLAVFNLLPAFPMDGGRVLRALLATRMDYVRATHIAANVGQAMAFLFGIWGLFASLPMLVFIALFVWIGAAQEASIVQMRSALGGIPVERVMITDFRSLSPQEPLSSAVEHILAGSQQDFPVVEEGRVVGILTRSDLLTGLTKRGQQAEISEVMQKKFETAAPSEMADRVFARLQRCNCHTLPVLRNGELVGIVTMENVGEFLMIQSALDEAKKGKKTIPTIVAADRRS
jgi:Zn-dependent protease